MRLSKARRLSKRLTEYEIDVVEHLEEAGYEFLKLGRVWYCRRRVNNLYFERQHPCAWQLALICYRVHKSCYLALVQSQLVCLTSMASALSANISAILKDREVKVRRLGGFRHTRPMPLPSLRKIDPEVASLCERHVPRDMVAGYHHSSCEKDLALQSAGYVVLTERPPVEFDFEVFYDMFVAMSLEMNEEPISVADMSAASQLYDVQGGASAGLLPLNTLYGVSSGAKKTMLHSAVAVNLAAVSWGGVPGCIPYKPAPKDEVIKVGKKVRTIMVESLADYLVLKHFYGSVVVDKELVFRGRAIGLSSVGGSFKQMFMRWFAIWLEYNDGGWNEFLTFMSEQPMTESDKSSWESSTNENDGLCYVLGLLLSVNCGNSKLLARALADYVNPGVQIDGDLVYFAPWRIPSGSFLTAHGNTERHHKMASFVCRVFREHGGVGRLGCDCRMCEIIKDLPGFGERLSRMQLDLLDAFFVMGDDFLGFGYGAVAFARIQDHVFGTTTKVEIKPMFGEPSLHEVKSVEFLRKHFYLDVSGDCWNVRCFRSAERVLAKLYHGRSRRSKETFKAALLSALWDTGANPELFAMLTAMLAEVKEWNLDLGVVRREVEKFVKRNPALSGLSPVFVPSYEVVLNADANLLKPLEKVYWPKVYAEQGLKFN